MEELPSIVVNQTNNKSKLIFLVLIVLLLGFLLGFYTNNLFVNKVQQVEKIVSPPAQPQIDESKLPISLSLLQNPIVYEWRGSVKGRVIAKNEHLFTIEDDKGNQIIITDKSPSGDIFDTAFLKKSASNWKTASSSAMSVGSNVRAEFFIFKAGKNVPVGSIFWID